MARLAALVRAVLVRVAVHDSVTTSGTCPRGHSREVAALMPLTDAERCALDVLAEGPAYLGPVTRRGFHKAFVQSTVATGLVRDGLARIVTDPVDERYSRIAITDDGLAALDQQILELDA